MLRRRKVRKIEEILDDVEVETMQQAARSVVIDRGAVVPPDVGAKREVAPPPRP